MSGLVNKIKEAVHSDKSHSGQPEGTSGPHTSRAANAADPRVDSDRDHRAAPGGLTGTHGTHTGTTGVAGTHTGTTGVAGTHGATTTAGPHSSNIANKADPRVDSDLDGRSGLGNTHHAGTTGVPGTHHAGTHTGAHTGTHTGAHTGVGGVGGVGAGTSGLTGTHGATGAYGSGGPGPAPNTAGPHGSDMMNKADPRVDSDMSKTHGHTGVGGVGGVGAGTHGTSGLTGTHGTTGAGYGTHGATTTAGPHSSNIANKADPRVDSDLDGRSGLGNTHHAGTTGVAGPHGTHTGTHTGAHTGAHTGVGGVGGVAGSGPGPAPNTAGPHKSDMLNKMDPRVDSNLDGSKTVGGNKTYQAGTTSGLAHKDPTDAAQVPPSVLQKTVGPPVVEHGDHHAHHDRIRRNSNATHQEMHRGI